MKKINLSLLTLIFLFLSAAVFAQEQKKDKKKKVVIITKIIDENGNETSEKIIHETSGDEVIIMHDGKEGSISDHKNINVDVDVTDNENQIKIKINKGGDDVEVIEWNGNGEIPADLLKKLEEKGINMEIDGMDNIFHIDTNDAPNSACLGVMIGKKETIENINGDETISTEGESDLGVPVLGVIENSGAEDAGLLEEDIIASINGTTVASIGDVLELLAPLDAGEEVSVVYLRDGQTNQTTATLKACANTNTNIEEEIEWIEDGNQNINIRKIIIKRDKDGESPVVEGVEVEEVAEDVDLVEPAVQTLDLQTIDVFPNPTAGELTLQFTAPAGPTAIKIMDVSGRLIYEEQLNNFDGNYKKEIDLGNAPKGTLILSIHQGDKVFSEKIILQK